MPAAIDVKPSGWTEIRVLFDDGAYSVVAGTCCGEQCLGERWNGAGDDPGSPCEGTEPRWHRVPDFLAEPVLSGLLNELLQRSDLAQREAFIERVLLELEHVKTRVAQI